MAIDRGGASAGVLIGRARARDLSAPHFGDLDATYKIVTDSIFHNYPAATG